MPTPDEVFESMRDSIRDDDTPKPAWINPPAPPEQGATVTTTDTDTEPKKAAAKKATTKEPVTRVGPDFTFALIGPELPLDPSPTSKPTNRELLHTNLQQCVENPNLYARVAAYSGKKTAEKAKAETGEKIESGEWFADVDGGFDIEVRGLREDPNDTKSRKWWCVFAKYVTEQEG